MVNRQGGGGQPTAARMLEETRGANLCRAGWRVVGLGLTGAWGRSHQIPQGWLREPDNRVRDDVEREKVSYGVQDGNVWC